MEPTTRNNQYKNAPTKHSLFVVSSLYEFFQSVFRRIFAVFHTIQNI